MHGDIYSIPIQGKTDNLDHLHLVALELGDQCLMVPAFGSGGKELADAIAVFGRKYIFPHQCSVELDNSKFVTFTAGKTGKLATWFVARRSIITVAEAGKYKYEGYMNTAGLLLVCDTLLEWVKVSPENLPPKIVRGIEALVKNLRK